MLQKSTFGQDNVDSISQPEIKLIKPGVSASSSCYFLQSTVEIPFNKIVFEVVSLGILILSELIQI